MGRWSSTQAYTFSLGEEGVGREHEDEDAEDPGDSGPGDARRETNRSLSVLLGQPDEVAQSESVVTAGAGYQRLECVLAAL